MRDLFPQPHDPLDAAVRARLDADGKEANAEHILATVFHHLDAEHPRMPGLTRRRALLLPLAVAAGLLLALFTVSHRNIARAEPADVLRQAQTAHLAPTDRCYCVQTEGSEWLRRRLPLLDFRREALLWTRGDRFWVEPALAGKGVWGRDEQGRVWLAPSRAAAVRYDSGELPELLALVCEARSVRLPTLLDEVLSDCDLSLEELPPAGLRVVLASPRPGARASFAGARIEVEDATGVVRKLVLRPRWLGKEVAVVTYTLLETGRQPDDAYRAEGQINPGASVYDRTQPGQRKSLLLRALGVNAP